MGLFIAEDSDVAKTMYGLSKDFPNHRVPMCPGFNYFSPCIWVKRKYV